MMSNTVLVILNALYLKYRIGQPSWNKVALISLVELLNVIMLLHMIISFHLTLLTHLRK